MALPATALRSLDTHLSVAETGALLIEEVPAPELAERFGTPVHVVSETRLRENYRRIRDAFAARWQPGVNVYFAIKSNPALALRRVLAQEGAGGDCLGLHELWASLVGGVDPKRLVLNGNNKTEEAIEAAVRCGARINLDDLEEISRVATAARRAGRVVPIGLRVKPDLERFGARRSELMEMTVRSYAAVSKWGLEPDQAVAAARDVLSRPELELVGVHYHLGRHFPEPELFVDVVPGLASILARLRDEAGWTPSFLAIGGGFTQGRDPFFRKPASGDPWPTATDSFVAPIEDFADALCGELARELDARAVPKPVLELEPGRYLTASAGVTLTRVGTVKRGAERTWVMVDTCVTHIGMSRSPRDAHALVSADGATAGDEVVCDVVGPLCVLDIIMEQGTLPEVERGALLAILDTGGYADGEASNANSIGRPAVVLVNGPHAELIRRRETFGDIFARDTVPAHLLGDGDPRTSQFGPAQSGDGAPA
jgi:diaminopimelate decarboxylase